MQPYSDPSSSSGANAGNAPGGAIATCTPCAAVCRPISAPISRHIERNGLRAAAGDGIGGNGRRLTAVQHQQDVVARAHTEPLLHVTGQSEARVNQVAVGGAAHGHAVRLRVRQRFQLAEQRTAGDAGCGRIAGWQLSGVRSVDGHDAMEAGGIRHCCLVESIIGAGASGGYYPTRVDSRGGTYGET